MKRKNKLIVFSILLIAVSLLLSNITYAAALTFNRIGDEVMDMDKSNDNSGVYDNFCIDSRDSFTWATSSAWGKSDAQRNDKYLMNERSTSSGEVPPSVGYAIWYLQKNGRLQSAYSSQENADWRALQSIIWNSYATYNERRRSTM